MTARIALLLAVAALTLAGSLTGSARAQAGIELEQPVLVPAFTLENHHRAAFTEADLQDQWTLLMIGYTTCPDVCPFTLANLEHVLAEVSQKVRPDSMPEVVFLALDPERDRENLGEYMDIFHPDFTGVTGAREEIDRLVEGIDATYRFTEPDEDGFYEVHHSSAVGVIDPKRRLRAKLQPPFDAYVTADLLARLQIVYRRENTQ